VTAGLATVGVRVPAHEIARQFIAACGVPIAAPSANLSTKISPTSASHVYEDMNGRIPLIIDGGECGVGIESTVLDITGEVPVILRPGAITAQMIADVLGEVKTHDGKILAAAPAPGMKYKHYAPVCDCVVADCVQSALIEYAARRNKGGNPVILCRGNNKDKYGTAAVVNLGDSDIEICAKIYGAMHIAEKEYDCIICEDFGNEGIAASVMNRVNKSAGGKRV
ncbi:MAG: L-threonylcarbamoyladenylate synthase, partial [Clostridia bacterium]|nr:L-threonylcarbamoyladenylate synthase [Clostridia bacterium]